MGKKSRHKRDRLAAETSPLETFTDYPLSENTEELRALLSGWINVTGNGLDGVSEETALGVPAFSRGVDLIAGTIAGLPLKTYTGEGPSRREIPSLFDDPTGPYEITPFGWVETIVMHLVVYREAYLLHLFNGAGALVGMYPVHPGNVTKVEWTSSGSKRYTVQDKSSAKVYGTPDDPTTDEAGNVLAIRQILGPSTTGLRGVPLFQSHRRIFQIAIAAEKASARTFTGALIGGLVTTAQDEELGDDPEAEAALILEKLNAKMSGTDNAGRLAFVNRHLEFKSWQMSNLDAQFSESRAFAIEEFARMLGLMPVHLAQTEKQTSWGAGIAEQNLGLARYCLMGYTSRMESALRQDLPFPEFVEFDYKGLLQGTPRDEIDLLLAETSGGLLDVDEARAVINLPPRATPQEVTTNG